MIKIINAMDEHRRLGEIDLLTSAFQNHFDKTTACNILVTDENADRPPLPSSNNKRIDITHSEEAISTMDYPVKDKQEILDLAETADVFITGCSKIIDEFVDYADEVDLTIYKESPFEDSFDEEDTFPPFELFFEEISSTHLDNEGVTIKYKRSI